MMKIQKNIDTIFLKSNFKNGMSILILLIILSVYKTFEILKNLKLTTQTLGKRYP